MGLMKAPNPQTGNWEGVDALALNDDKGERVTVARIKNTESQLTTVSSQLADIVTLKPNGVDDTAALQACNGKTVKLGAGTFITSMVTWGANTHIDGSGMGKTIIKLKDGSHSTLIDFKNPNSSSIKNLTLHGNKINNNADPIDAKSSVIKMYTSDPNDTKTYWANLSNLIIENSANHGLSVLANDGYGWNWVHHFDNISIVSCEGYGFYDQGTDNKYSNFYITSCYRAGMVSTGGANMYSNFKIDWSGGDTSFNRTGRPLVSTDSMKLLSDSGAGLILKNATYSSFSNLDVQSISQVGVKILGSSNISFSNAHINNCGTLYTSTKDYQHYGLGLIIDGSSDISGDISFHYSYVIKNQMIDIEITSTSANCNLIVPTLFENQIINNSNSCSATSLNDKEDFTVKNTVNEITTTNLLGNVWGSNAFSWHVYKSNVDITYQDLGNNYENGVVVNFKGTDKSNASAYVGLGIQLKPNHKYFVRMDIKSLGSVTWGTLRQTAPHTSYYSRYNNTYTGGLNFKTLMGGFDTNGVTVNEDHFFRITTIPLNGEYQNVEVKNPIMIDLTELFGVGNEPPVYKVNEWLSNTGYIKYTKKTSVFLYRNNDYFNLVLAKKLDNTVSTTTNTNGIVKKYGAITMVQSNNAVSTSVVADGTVSITIPLPEAINSKSSLSFRITNEGAANDKSTILNWYYGAGFNSIVVKIKNLDTVSQVFTASVVAQYFNQ